jgi:diguanylate cyclase
MSLSDGIIIAAVALAVVNLPLGWLLGRRRAPYCPASPVLPQRDARDLHDVAQRLAEQVANVNRDVNQHQGRLQQVNRELLDAQPDEQSLVAKSVLASVAEILRINAQLQNRLLAAEEKLQDQGQQIQSWMEEARTDALTGLPNRRAFADALELQIAVWRRKNLAFSVMIIDADHFKAINDRHGHLVGDAVLRRLADAIQGSLRKMDLVARVGGEEFAVILPSTPGTDACRAAEHCRLAIAATGFQSDDLCVPLTISIGVAVVTLPDDGDALLNRADQALYAAKLAGRNRVCFHDGQRCQPAGASAATSNDSPPTAAQSVAETTSAPDVENNTDLLAVCRDLRERLAEMAGDS